MSKLRKDIILEKLWKSPKKYCIPGQKNGKKWLKQKKKQRFLNTAWPKTSRKWVKKVAKTLKLTLNTALLAKKPIRNAGNSPNGPQKHTKWP